MDTELIETLDGDLGLESLPIDALVQFCKELGIPARGSKGLIAARLRKFYQEMAQ
jgi:hypothetical protein